MTSDVELLVRWREGDSAAGNALVKRHFDSVCRFFRSKLGDDVSDLIQRTFLDCVKARETIDESIGFRPFLYAIAHRRLIDELRRRGRRPAMDPARDSLMDLGISPSLVLAEQAEARILARALQSLPLQQQVTLELFYWEGLRGKEMAGVFGVSEHTIRSRLARAKDALRSAMERDADDPELAARTFDGLQTWAQRVAALIDTGPR